MIASVRGEVIDIALDHVVIEAAGVGYRLNATPSTLATLRRGADARLFTAMVVREDSMTLFAFHDTDSRELFHLLQTVSGIGPRIAMAILAVLEPDVLCKALAEGNTTVLTRVPGIGKRGAERLVVELRDKVVVPSADDTAIQIIGGPVRDHVIEALVGLGFAQKQAETAADSVFAADPAANASSALRSALAMLGKR